MSAPERVCVVWPNPQGAGLAFRAEKKQGREFVCADLFDALQAENERLRKEAEEAYEKGWDAAMERAASDAKQEAERDY